MRGNSMGRYSFILLAGVYLIYLAWQLLNGYRTADSGNIIFLLTAILFFIAGVVIIIGSGRQVIRHAKDSSAMDDTADSDTLAESDISEETDTVMDTQADTVSIESDEKSSG